jgi:hypothetical protein
MLNGKSACRRVAPSMRRGRFAQAIVVGVAVMLGALVTQMAPRQAPSVTASDCAPLAPGAPMVVNLGRARVVVK